MKSERSRRRVLVILAHQDDEFALAPWIRHETQAGADVTCIFLTDGRLGASPAIRNAESIAALARLGVPGDRVIFAGELQGIRDGSLHAEAALALSTLEACTADTTFDRIYSLEWEGGHHDHDATHLIALAFAMRRGMIDCVRFAPLYSGWRTPGPFFRVVTPIRAGDWEVRRVSLAEAFAALSIIPLYRSQRRTWLALGPQVAWRLLAHGTVSLRSADLPVVLKRPHPGRLYYERRFGVSYEAFSERMQPFIDQHLIHGCATPAEPERDSRQR